MQYLDNLVYGDLIIIVYPKPYSIYLRRTITPYFRVQGSKPEAFACFHFVCCSHPAIVTVRENTDYILGSTYIPTIPLLQGGGSS